jgi:membrane associated rhomboid family serine protease
MKLSEGWKRLFIVLSAVYWVIALWASVAGAFIGNGLTQSSWGFLLTNLGASVLTYAAVAGMVAGVVWIVAGFRKSKARDQ